MQARAAAAPIQRASVARCMDLVNQPGAWRAVAREWWAVGLRSGTIVRQRRSEAPSIRAIESVSTRKNAPVTPPSRTNGKKIASEQRLDPTSVGRISAIAWERV